MKNAIVTQTHYGSPLEFRYVALGMLLSDGVLGQHCRILGSILTPQHQRESSRGNTCRSNYRGEERRKGRRDLQTDRLQVLIWCEILKFSRDSGDQRKHTATTTPPRVLEFKRLKLGNNTKASQESTQQSGCSRGGQGGRCCFLSLLTSESNPRTRERFTCTTTLHAAPSTCSSPPDRGQGGWAVVQKGPGERQTSGLPRSVCLFWLEGFAGSRAMAQIKRWHVWTGRKAASTSAQTMTWKRLTMPSANS